MKFLPIVVLAVWINVQVAHSRFYDVDTVYEIQMMVFSGKPDHSWNIDKTHQNYQQIATSINSCSPSSMYEGLGYAGFTITARNALGQMAYKTVGRGKSTDLETLLVQTFPGKMSHGLQDHIMEGILGHPVVHAPIQTKTVQYQIVIRKEDKRRRKRQARRGCPGRVFNPAQWNYQPVQRRNNCYNYATNIRTDTFAQPGRGSGQRHSAHTAENVYSACLRDGLIPIRELSSRQIPSGGRYCVIALVIWPGEDFHFMRMDADGLWSQKNGRGPARNYDDSNNPISDPRYCDRGPYSVFAGFLGVHRGITIR